MLAEPAILIPVTVSVFGDPTFLSGNDASSPLTVIFVRSEATMAPGAKVSVGIGDTNMVPSYSLATSGTMAVIVFLRIISDPCELATYEPPDTSTNTS